MAIQSNFPAIKPSLLLDFANTKQLDPRITFTRASTATYYNGVTTAKAEENLLTYSQQFDNGAWQKGSSTVTADSIAAPDGTTTADTLTASAGTALFPRISPATLTGTANAVHVASIYVKAGTIQYIQLASAAGTAWHCNFDVTSGAGAVGTSSNCTGSIVDAGNGWFRCVVSYTPTTTDVRVIFLIETSASASRTATWNPVGTEALYLWGAQVEQRSAVTAYTATTTQAITNYIPQLLTAASGVARFDHNPTTDESLGLLIEEQRTNLLTYSEQFNDATWTKSATSITANIAIAPDGTLVADKIVEDTATSAHYIATPTSFVFTSGVTYTLSAFVKKAEVSFVQLNAHPGVVSNSYANFDLTNGTVTASANSTSQITNCGNGWYRCSITYVATSSVTTRAGFIYLITSGSASVGQSYTGNGWSGIYIWGAQFEVGAFSTSYIQTVASQVTRSADAASMTGTNFSSWYNQGEGTIYSEYSHASTTTNNPAALSVNNNGNTNQIVIYGEGAVGEKFFVRTNGTIQATITASSKFASGVMGKVAGAYNVDNFSVSANGATAVSDNAGLVPAVSQMNIGSEYNGSLPLNGTIKKIAYYPMRVTNSNLQALTS